MGQPEPHSAISLNAAASQLMLSLMFARKQSLASSGFLLDTLGP